MKAYSTSKISVVFVIVLLLSLSYAFAGKPTDKPGKPTDPPPEYITVWSVYIPVNADSGIQGDSYTLKCSKDGTISCPSELPTDIDTYYVFDGEEVDGDGNPGTGNDVFTYRDGKSKVSGFRFRVFAESDARVKLGISGTTGSISLFDSPEVSIPFDCNGTPPIDKEVENFKDYVYQADQVCSAIKNPQPLLPFTEIYFDVLFKDKDYYYDDLPPLESSPIYSTDFEVSNTLTTVEDPNQWRFVRGIFTKGSKYEITRINDDTWHISYAPCADDDPNLSVYLWYAPITQEFTFKAFDLYFVRKLVQIH